MFGSAQTARMYTFYDTDPEHSWHAALVLVANDTAINTSDLLHACMHALLDSDSH
jgi:hypothetical protein